MSFELACKGLALGGRIAYRIAVLLLLSGILINLEVLVEAQIASALNTKAIAQMFDELYMQPWEMAP